MSVTPRPTRPRVSLALATVLVLAWGTLAPASAFAATLAGKVLSSRGITSAQLPGEAVRFVGTGDPIFEGDVVRTGARGVMVLGLADGTRMALKSGTVFAFESFKHDAGEESAVMRLFKGGLRALTGLVGKRNPQGFKLVTPVATIGIRGTEFDARLCTDDCAQESALEREAEAAGTSRVIARVAFRRGNVRARSTVGQLRPLIRGSPIYRGDTIVTSARANAVLAFRDKTRITVQPSSELQIERYEFAPESDTASDGSGASGTESSALFRLFKGGLRAVTGLVAKRKPKAFEIQTSVATIGIRGTRFDLFCQQACAEPLATASIWRQVSNMLASLLIPTATAQPDLPDLVGLLYDGVLDVTGSGGQAPLRVTSGQNFGLSGSNDPFILDSVPAFIQQLILDGGQAPEEVPGDIEDLSSKPEDGALFVHSRDQQVIVEVDGEVQLLEPGEALAVFEGGVDKLAAPPTFLVDHPALELNRVWQILELTPLGLITPEPQQCGL